MSERLVVVWRVTERCNLQCPFCAYDRRLNRPRNSADPEEIRRFAAVLAQWRDFAGRPVLLSWLGGEPLLWEPLTALTRHCRRELGLAISTMLVRQMGGTLTFASPAAGRTNGFEVLLQLPRI